MRRVGLFRWLSGKESWKKNVRNEEIEYKLSSLKSTEKTKMMF